MTLMRIDPFRDLRTLQRRMDRLFSDAMTGYTNGSDEEGITANWAPAVDIFEAENQIVLRAELPGLTEDDVEITVDNNRLTVRGEKRLEREETEGEYRRVESRYGAFYRTFPLPTTVDQDKIDAHFDKGVLEIDLPKVEAAKPKRIAVKAN